MPALPRRGRVERSSRAMTTAEKVAQLYGVWVGASDDGEDVAPHQHDMDDDVDLDAILPPASASSRGRSAPPRSIPPRRAVAHARAAADRRLEPVRHPGARARGVPRGLRDVGRDRLPGAAQLGRVVRPGAGARDGRAASAPTCARSACTRVSRRCSMSSATPAGVASRRRSARIPYLVGTVATAYVRAWSRPASSPRSSTSSGIRRRRAAQSRAGLDRPARARRRAAAAVRDGDPRERRALGDELVHRHRRHPDGRRPAPAHRAAARHVGLRRHRRRRLLLDRVPQGAARRQRGLDGGRARRPRRRASTSSCRPSRPSARALVLAVDDGAVDEALVDRACAACCGRRRNSGCWTPTGRRCPLRSSASLSDSATTSAGASTSTRPPTATLAAPARRGGGRAPARNDGVLPLASTAPIAVIGPTADRSVRRARAATRSRRTSACASRGRRSASSCRPCARRSQPSSPVPRSSLRGHRRRRRRDRRHRGGGRSGVRADVVVLALGDRAGLFGRGTSGEGCDAADLALPGAQQAARGRPRHRRADRRELLAGRPYALGPAPERAAAIVQTFFPGRGGARRDRRRSERARQPRGRLPVGVPRSRRAAVDLSRPDARRRNEVSTSTRPRRSPFGHGLGYSTFVWSDAAASADVMAIDGTVTVSMRRQRRRPRRRRGRPAVPRTTRWRASSGPCSG